ncbi:hypothetical protein [Larkinella rosea]|uniref:Uma2 family endonuclease n=1 Tax=Larkinella rosea TaxID=2025312 RepID=A0A3P1BFY1_9BACT|nr:hypothetical protein [Larkinella rosea]RRB00027.1 hypothetical protein EHT25_25725 [Larkinella rosea]
MYYTGDDVPFLAREKMGTNAPKQHQRVIGKLMLGLGSLFYSEKTIPFEPFVETMLDEGKSSPTPDLLLYDNGTDQTPVIIEICHSAGLQNDIEKVIWLTDKNNYGIREAFVYNYKTLQWLRYRKGDAGLTTESSYSEILQINLNDFLE